MKMNRIVSLLVCVLIFLAMIPIEGRTQGLSPEYRPKLNSLKQCDVNRMGKTFCLEYFADELELVVGDSIFKPMPSRVEEFDGVRSAMGQGKAETYEFYSSRFDRKLGLNSEIIEKVHEVGFDHIIRIRFKNINSDQDLLALMVGFAQDKNVRSISLSSVVYAFGEDNFNWNYSNDPLFKNQWYFLRERFDKAQEKVGFGSPEIHTTFFDTGYDISHEDLPALAGWYNHLIPENTVAYDRAGHGTMVAGVLAQIPNNGKGGVGTSPGVSIWVRKVLSDAGGGSWDTVAEAIVAQTAECVKMRNANPNVRCTFNFSLGGLGPVPSIDAALDMAYKEGIIAVASAGNTSVDLARFKVYPAAKPGTIAATALDVEDNLTLFSPYGTEGYVVAVAGLYIETTVPGNTYFTEAWGTSFATPQVVGAINLAWSAHRDLTPNQIRMVTMSGTDVLPKLQPLITSGGRLNALLMVDLPPEEELVGSPKKFTVINTTHVGITTSQSFDGKVAGFINYISEEPFDEETLDRKNVRKIFTFDPSLVSFPNQVSTRVIRGLSENTTHFTRTHGFSRRGSLSTLSNTVEFSTKKSKIHITRTFTTPSGNPDPGQWHPENGWSAISPYDPIPWHLSDIMPSPSGTKQLYWRLGRKAGLDYIVGQGDWILKSEIFDLRRTGGVSLTFDYFQYTSPVWPIDRLELYAIPLNELGIEPNPIAWILLKDFNVNNNSKDFLTKEQLVDLSNVITTRFRLAFRVLNYTGGQFGGIGWMFGNIKIHLDDNNRLY